MRLTKTDKLFFQAALTVNLTNMLVLTTIFISVMQTLPKTAYVKHVDIWLIFCQLIPFIEVLLITAAESLRGADENGEIIYNHHGHTRTIRVTPSPDDDPAIKGQKGPPTPLSVTTGKSTRDWIIFAGRLKTHIYMCIVYMQTDYWLFLHMSGTLVT